MGIHARADSMFMFRELLGVQESIGEWRNAPPVIIRNLVTAMVCAYPWLIEELIQEYIKVLSDRSDTMRHRSSMNDFAILMVFMSIPHIKEIYKMGFHDIDESQWDSVNSLLTIVVKQRMFKYVIINHAECSDFSPVVKKHVESCKYKKDRWVPFVRLIKEVSLIASQTDISEESFEYVILNEIMFKTMGILDLRQRGRIITMAVEDPIVVVVKDGRLLRPAH